MDFYGRVARPILFRWDAERVHDGSVHFAETLGAARCLRRAVDRHYALDDPRLRVEVAGLSFRSPLGLAAGYDKNARAAPLLASLGFGHVEIGSVSATRSHGNPPPRLWRVPADHGIVVHYGVPNDGADRIAQRLAVRRPDIPTGLNLVNTNHGPDAPERPDEEILDDYVSSARRLHPVADYLCLNLSCPNTRDGQGFFLRHGRLATLMTELGTLGLKIPVFLKIAPFESDTELGRFVETVSGLDLVAGFSVNLPPGKPGGMSTPATELAGKPGAVSGPPCRTRADRTIAGLYRRMDRERHVIIGSGGVSSAEDAYLKIRLGASLVQLFTVLIYAGPGVVNDINRGIAELASRDGFDSIAEAVGTG